MTRSGCRNDEGVGGNGGWGEGGPVAPPPLTPFECLRVSGTPPRRQPYPWPLWVARLVRNSLLVLLLVMRSRTRSVASLNSPPPPEETMATMRRRSHACLRVVGSKSSSSRRVLLARDVDGGEDAALGQAAVQVDLAVARALELLAR